MRDTAVVSLLVCLLAGSLAGCGGRRDVYERSLETAGPFPVLGSLCYLHRTLGDLVCLRAGPEGVEQKRTWVGPAPRVLVEADNHGLLAVLNDDLYRPGVTLVEPVSLDVIGFLELSEQFDTLVVSPTSRYGVAYFAGAGDSPWGIRNLNQVQVVDFAGRRVQAPLALQTGGLSPRGIDFLPEGGTAFDDLAVIRVDNGLVLLDLAEPAQEPLWVRFTNSPGGLAVPAEVVFGPFFADGGYLYTRLQGSDDVLSVRVTREEGRLHRTINFLNVPAGSRPVDLLVPDRAVFDDKVFVVYGTSAGQAALLDANAIQTEELALTFDSPVTRSRVLVSDDGARQYLAVFRADGSTRKIYLVDPASGETETVTLQDDIDSVSGPEDGSFLVAFHEQLGGSGGPGLRVIRMSPSPTSGRTTHRIATYSLTRELTDYSFSSGGSTLVGALALDPIGFVLDLSSGEYQALELDRTPVATGVIPGTNWSWFQHAHPLGSITLVPLDSFVRSEGVQVEGFMMDGLLDPQ